ncbi:MAG: hypothetical protein PSV16_13995 [Flavobacterium sp.]|nr:hypothetical protein [Flavobacterium sp.]
MENKKDIGRLFREKLNNLDTTPNDAVWSAINADLDKKKKRRFVFFFLAAGAGILMLLLGITASKGMFFSAGKDDVPVTTPKQNKSRLVISDTTEFQSKIESDTTFKNKKITKSKATTTKKLIKSTNEVEEYEVVTKYKIYVRKSKSTTITTTKTAAANNKATIQKTTAGRAKFAGAKHAKTLKSKKRIRTKVLASKGFKSKKKRTIASKKKTYKSKKIASKNYGSKNIVGREDGIIVAVKNDTMVQQLPVKNTDSLQNVALKEAEKKTDTLKKKREYKPQKPPVEEKEFQTYVSVFVGPTYYDSFSQSSGLIKSGDNFDKKGNVRASAGFYGRAMFNDKIGIRLGFILTGLGYTTTIFPNDTGFYLLNNVDVPFNSATTNFNTHFEGTKEVKLVQKTNYFEIPVDFYYVFNDEGKIGVDGFTGFSAYFLNKSKIIAKGDGKSDLDLGEASNTKGAVFGWNLGAVFNYKLTKNWRFDVSPLIKYQLKPFSNNTDFKPLTYSIQFGLTCKL